MPTPSPILIPPSARTLLPGRARGARVTTTLVVLAMLAASVAACGATTTSAPSPVASPSPAANPTTPVPSTSASAPAGSPSSPSLSSPPESPSAAPSPSVGQTDTDWGRIWDAAPASFPAYPGSTTTEIGHASSDQRIVTGAADEVATWYQEALETAGYSTEAMSGPLEDGSLVIDSVGDPLECRVQVSVRPVAELIVIDILYGADCPST